jgi:hypothetical protein
MKILILLFAILVTLTPASAITYEINPALTYLIPFEKADIYNPINLQWYSANLVNNLLIVNNTYITSPDVVFYPSVAQANKLIELQSSINANGLSFYDKLQIASLYYSIDKYFVTQKI